MSPQLPTLRSGGAEVLDKLLHETVSRKDIPAMIYLATNAKETIYANQEGEKVFGDESSGQIDADTYTEMFSQTKLITCLAALQLVDRGVVSLDSEADVEKHLPEIGALPLLTGYGEDGQPVLTKAQNKVTLRMLMSHSAGFVYASADSLLSGYIKLHPEDVNIFDKTASVKTLCKPLIYEPGTAWLYSTSVDWVGKLVERASGQRLDEYFQTNIFDPLGCKTLTFFPTHEVKQKKMAVCTRKPDGTPVPLPGGAGMGRPMEIENISTDLLLGGAGLFGNQRDYLTILRAILQSDPSSPHLSEKPLLSPSSFKELFTGSVPYEAGRKGMVEQVSRPAYFEPAVTKDNVDHSVGFLLNLEDMTGRRKKNSGTWSGAAKTQFWIDPTTGIAGICATQLLSPAPDPWFAKYTEYEKVLYSQLE